MCVYHILVRCFGDRDRLETPGAHPVQRSKFNVHDQSLVNLTSITPERTVCVINGAFSFLHNSSQ